MRRHRHDYEADAQFLFWVSLFCVAIWAFWEFVP